MKTKFAGKGMFGRGMFGRGMRLLLLLAFIPLPFIPLPLLAADKINIVVPASYTGDAAISRQPLTLTATAPLPRVYTTNIFSRQPISRTTDTNGLCTFSNILWGYYRLDIPGNPGTSFNLVVSTNLSGTVNVAVLITNAAALPPWTSTNYYTIDQSDARYATIGSGGSGSYTNDTGLPGKLNAGGTAIGTNLGTLATTQSVLDATNTARLTTQLGIGTAAYSNAAAFTTPAQATNTVRGMNTLTNFDTRSWTNSSTAVKLPGVTFWDDGGFWAANFEGDINGGYFSGDGTALTNLTLTAANAAAIDNRLFFRPQNFNLNFTNSGARVRAGKALRVYQYGDTAFDPETPLISMLNAGGLKRHGGLGFSGGFYYPTVSSGVVQAQLSPGVKVPIIVYGMPDGSGLTNTALLSDTIVLNYVRSNNFGTLTIQTNNGSGGTFTTVKVLDANSGGERVMATTNFAVSPGTWAAVVISTGTNLTQGAGQYYSTIATNYVYDLSTTGNTEVYEAMTNAFYSNSLVTVMQNYDLLIVTDACRSNNAYLGFPMLYHAATNRGLTTDVLFLNPPPITNDVAATWNLRVGNTLAAYDYGLSMLDIGSLFLPLDTTKLVPYYTADGVHLSSAGNTLGSTEVAKFILNPYAQAAASGGGTTYTNSTSAPGVIVGSGIGTNVNGNQLTASGILQIKANANTTNLTVSGTLTAPNNRESLTVAAGTNSGTSGAGADLWLVAGNGGTLSGNAGNIYALMRPPASGASHGVFGVLDVSSNVLFQVLGDTGAIYGNGLGLTNLNASQLTSGTVPMARLDGTKVLTNNNVNAVFVLYTNAAAANGMTVIITSTNLFGTNYAAAASGFVLSFSGGYTNSKGYKTDGTIQGPAAGLFLGNSSGNNVIADTSDFRSSAYQDLGRASIRWGTLYSGNANVTNAVTATLITATNGYILPPLTAIPTNSITAWTGTATNWTIWNWNGTNVQTATNIAAAGSFIHVNLESALAANTNIVFTYGINLEDHFIYGNLNASAYVGNFFSLANSGAITVQGAIDVSHPGIILFTTSTSASSAPTLYTSGASALLGAGRGADVEFVWRVEDLSSDAENYLARMGLQDSTSTTAPVDGVYVRYSNNTNGGNLEFVARANSAESFTNTAFPVAADAWITNRIVVNSTSTLATIYTNGVVAATLDTNIPDVDSSVARSTSLGSFQIIKQAGTTARLMYLDYWKAKH